MIESMTPPTYPRLALPRDRYAESETPPWRHRDKFGQLRPRIGQDLGRLSQDLSSSLAWIRRSSSDSGRDDSKRTMASLARVLLRN